MTIRSGMVDLVNELRLLTETVSVTTDTVNYMSDDDLQTILDRYVTPIRYSLLLPSPTIVPGNTLVYYNYVWGASIGTWVERPVLPYDERFLVQDSTGAYVFYGTESEQYTVNVNQSLIIFGKDRSSDSFYLSTYSYDLNGAASEIWMKKANKLSGSVDWKTDNHTVHMSQYYDHCIDRANYYRSVSRKAAMSRFIRVDMNANNNTHFT